MSRAWPWYLAALALVAADQASKALVLARFAPGERLELAGFLNLVLVFNKGAAFSMFADAAVLSRESIYTANFMKYGFTPGMGSTLILPHKLGPVLAHEMMLSARVYRGEDLARRGVPFPVLPRDQVLPHAMALARDFADKPRFSLVTLKDHLVAGLRDALRHWWLLLRTSSIGSVLGAIPGLGGSVTDWIVYGHAIQTEKNGQFGKGDVRGVIAVEASNNAREGGALIPTLFFGIPSSGTMASMTYKQTARRSEPQERPGVPQSVPAASVRSMVDNDCCRSGSVSRSSERAASMPSRASSA